MLNARAPRRARGFTLVELLVVIAIIGILVALLLPAVQAAREAARRMQCGNNIKQLSLAIHNHHDTFKRLPPGYLGQAPGTVGVNAQCVGMLAFILPFMELNNVYDQIGIDLGIDKYPPSPPAPAKPITQFWADSATWRVAQTRIPGFLCPSTNTYNAKTNMIAHQQSNDLTVNTWYLTPFTVTVNAGRTNYLGCTGAISPNNTDPFYSLYPGVMWNRSLYTFGDMVDGTSNTLLVGETEGEWVKTGTSFSHESAHMWIGCGILPTAWGLPGGVTAWGAQNDRKCSRVQFGSAHAGGVVQFGLADGSVRTVSPTTDVLNYIAAGGMRDGKVVDHNGL